MWEAQVIVCTIKRNRWKFSPSLSLSVAHKHSTVQVQSVSSFWVWSSSSTLQPWISRRMESAEDHRGSWRSIYLRPIFWFSCWYRSGSHPDRWSTQARQKSGRQREQAIEEVVWENSFRSARKHSWMKCKWKVKCCNLISIRNHNWIQRISLIKQRTQDKLNSC